MATSGDDPYQSPGALTGGGLSVLLIHHSLACCHLPISLLSQFYDKVVMAPKDKRLD